MTDARLHPVLSNDEVMQTMVPAFRLVQIVRDQQGRMDGGGRPQPWSSTRSMLGTTTPSAHGLMLTVCSGGAMLHSPYGPMVISTWPLSIEMALDELIERIKHRDVVLETIWTPLSKHIRAYSVLWVADSELLPYQPGGADVFESVVQRVEMFFSMCALAMARP